MRNLWLDVTVFISGVWLADTLKANQGWDLFQVQAACVYFTWVHRKKKNGAAGTISLKGYIYILSLNERVLQIDCSKVNNLDSEAFVVCR